MTRPRHATAPKIALVTAPGKVAKEVVAVANARGLAVEMGSLDDAISSSAGVIAYAPTSALTARQAAELAPLCTRAANERKPIVLLCPHDDSPDPAALAMLRTSGAIVTHDPDVWFETAALISSVGAPAGPRVAIVAEPDTWLFWQATALAQESQATGTVDFSIAANTDVAPPVDAVIVNASDEATLSSKSPVVIVPVAARAESLGKRAVVVGLRSAIAAVRLAGTHSRRLAEGLGRAPLASFSHVNVDRDRVRKAFARTKNNLGDHQSKLLLSAFDIPTLRQGVAQSPSAAVRIAKTCGFPVQLKPWDPAHNSPDGPIESDLKNAPDVRRAFAAVASSVGLPIGVPVIVRVTPPSGRQLSARIERVAHLGWMVFVETPGSSVPLAAPAPLRMLDAEALAAGMPSTRADDAPPNREKLAELLARASLAAVDRDETVERILLDRIVVGKDDAVVVDCRVELKTR